MIYKSILLYADTLLSTLGTLVIVYAALKAMIMFIKGVVSDSLSVNKLRCELGYGIILGLEFMIGADIIESMAQPTYYDIGILASLVFIRTFLSYVLGKELEALSSHDKKAINVSSMDK